MSLDSRGQTTPGPLPTEAPPSNTLVWTTDASGARVTWTLDSLGAVIDRTEGVRVASRGRMWTWRAQQTPVRIVACPTFDASGNPVPRPVDELDPAPGHATRVSLEGAGAAESQVIVAPATVPEELDGFEFAHDVTLVASVGPYLFVRESTDVGACSDGYNGTQVRALVWDADRGAVRWDYDQARPFEADRERAMHDEAVKHWDGWDGLSREEDGSLAAALTMLRPAYARDGSLTLGVQFTVTPHCCECSDGEWTTHTWSTTVPSPSLPTELAAWATPPEPVRTFATKHADLQIGGYSTMR